MKIKTTRLSIKKLLLLIVLCSFVKVQAQDVLFKEDFGTATSEKEELIEDHVWSYLPETGIGYTYTGALNVRTNNPSDYTDASGDGNLYFNGEPSVFTISGIKTSGYTDILLSFGVFGKDAGQAKEMTVSYKDGDNDEVLLLDLNNVGLTATKKTWELLSDIPDLPASESLSLIFASKGIAEIRIDDVIIKGVKNTSGIVSDTKVTPRIYNKGKTLYTSGIEKGNIEIISITGSTVAVYPAASMVQLNLPKGSYIAKSGKNVCRIQL